MRTRIPHCISELEATVQYIRKLEYENENLKNQNENLKNENDLIRQKLEKTNQLHFHEHKTLNINNYFKIGVMNNIKNIFSEILQKHGFKPSDMNEKEVLEEATMYLIQKTGDTLVGSYQLSPSCKEELENKAGEIKYKLLEN